MNFMHQSYRALRGVITCPAIRSLTMSNSLRQEALEDLKTNPYFDKYAQKILEKQKVSPEEFYSRLEEHATKKKTTKRVESDSVKKSFTPGEPKSSLPPQQTSTTLDKIMKIELIEDKTSEEIKKIWEEFHKSKESTISATVPVDTFKVMREKAVQHPIFLLPLPRNQGYEFIMLQFAGTEIHFTPLISYQAHKENAPECMAIIYYPELAEKKNIVLMRGEYDKNIINVMEAQCLANQVQIFYGEKNEKRDKLMERFTYHPEDFKHMDLIAEIECISI